MAELGRLLVLLLILSQAVLGCVTELPRDRVSGPLTYQGSVDILLNGFRRTYLVHVPTGYRAGNALPLLVVIHGAFDTAQGMEKVSSFSRLADRENFVVLYPNGMGILGLLQHWNAGHCCGKAAEDRLDDVGFIAAAIEDVCARLTIDRERIFVTGFSNGGMLAYRFAAERGDLLAGAAPLAASIGGRASADTPEWRIPEPVRSLPLLVMHGGSDDDVPYEGGVSLHRGGTRTYLPVEESVEFWVKSNSCSTGPTRSLLYGGRVLRTRWSDCQDSAEVVLYRIEGWGHVWPGGSLTTDLPADDPLRNLDAAEIIWEFFKSHSRLDARRR
jgi:polyhydroxybutyrate depolymerase